jgi:IstB-like ATP binding protein
LPAALCKPESTQETRFSQRLCCRCFRGISATTISPPCVAAAGDVCPTEPSSGSCTADFGEADGYIGGKKVRFHYFCMDLPHSDGCFVKAYPAETAVAFSQRYERGSTIVTTNLPFDEWTSIFGSERLTSALLDRLSHHVHILEINGESYRLTASKKAQRQSARRFRTDCRAWPIEPVRPCAASSSR